MRNARWSDLLAQRTYARFWSGLSVSSLGDALTRIALPVYALEVTGNPAVLGASFALIQLPWAVLSPLAGVVADRVDRTRLLRLLLLLEAIAVGTVALAAQTAWHFLVLATLVGTFQVMRSPIITASLPELIGADALPKAFSLQAATIQLTDVIGLISGGLLVAVFGPRPVLLLDVVTFVVFILLVPPLPRGHPEKVGRKQGARQMLRAELARGLPFLVRHQHLRGTILAMMFRGATVTACLSLLYPLLQARGMGPDIYGIAAASFGASLFISSLITGHLDQKLPAFVALGVLSAAGGALAIMIGAIPSTVVTVCALVALGLVYAPGNVAVNIELARHAPRDVRGQVVGAAWGAIKASQALGGAVLGLVAAAYFTGLSFMIAGAVLLVTGTLVARVLWHVAPQTGNGQT